TRAASFSRSSSGASRMPMVPSDHGLGRDKAHFPVGHVSSSPGSRAGLLPPSPLRTARESFPSSSSSLANAPCGTRWCHIQRLAMDLPVAVGVQENTVVCGITASMCPPDHMMVVPSCEFGDLLVAHRTEAVLVFP